MTKDNNTRRADNFGEEQHDGRDNESDKNTAPDALIISRMTGIDLWRVELAIESGFSPSRVKTAAVQLREAKRWIIESADAWSYIVRGARADATEGKRVSIARLVENARKREFLNADGEPTHYDNTNDSIIARILIIKVPEIVPLIELRRSVYDFLIGGDEFEC